MFDLGVYGGFISAVKNIRTMLKNTYRLFRLTPLVLFIYIRNCVNSTLGFIHSCVGLFSQMCRYNTLNHNDWDGNAPP